MARPSKSVDVMSKNLTKEEYAIRKETEEKLKGDRDKIRPPTHLNKNAKKIFRYITSQLEESKILSNLDIYILSSCAIAIDRIETAEALLEEDILNKDARIVQDTYMKQFFRLCNELCLSPQSRSKIANATLRARQEEEDPLRKALEDDDE